MENPRVGHARERFDNINLSDCLLLSVGMTHRHDARPIVEFDIDLVAGEWADRFEAATFVFADCIRFNANVNLWALDLCRGAIAESDCRPLTASEEGELRESGLGDEYDLASVLAFTIRLVDPSGVLEVVAPDFELRRHSE